MAWYVYIVKCEDNKLYTGVTNNIERRVKAHNEGKGCRFTTFRTPVRLEYKEECLSKSHAFKREIQIKKFRRKNKIELISRSN